MDYWIQLITDDGDLVKLERVLAPDDRQGFNSLDSYVADDHRHLVGPERYVLTTNTGVIISRPSTFEFKQCEHCGKTIRFSLTKRVWVHNGGVAGCTADDDTTTASPGAE